MDLKAIRKAKKVSVEKTGLNARTVSKIESGSDQVSVKNLKIYLESIDLTLTYSIK